MMKKTKVVFDRTCKSEERMHHEAMQALSDYVYQYEITIDDLLNMIRTLPIGHECIWCATDRRDESMRWPGVMYAQTPRGQIPQRWFITSYRCYRCHNQWIEEWNDDELNPVPTAETTTWAQTAQ